MNKKLMGLVLGATLLLTGCGAPKLENGEEVVAKINGLEVTANDIYKKMKSTNGTGVTVDLLDAYIANKAVPTDDAAKAYVDAQITMYQSQYEDFEATLVEAGYTGLAQFKEILLDSYKKNKVAEDYYAAKLTDEEIKKYYDEDFYGDMDVRHILIKPEEKTVAAEQTAANEAALTKAKELIVKLNEGADFATLAKENSADTASAKEGGLIENVNKAGYVTEFFEAATKLENGKYTAEPVKTTYGYHIILKVSSDAKKSLDDAKAEIKTTLVSNIMSGDKNAFTKAWLEIRKENGLEIFDKDIKVIYNNNADKAKTATTEE